MGGGRGEKREGALHHTPAASASAVTVEMRREQGASVPEGLVLERRTCTPEQFHWNAETCLGRAQTIVNVMCKRKKDKNDWTEILYRP